METLFCCAMVLPQASAVAFDWFNVLAKGTVKALSGSDTAADEDLRLNRKKATIPRPKKINVEFFIKTFS